MGDHSSDVAALPIPNDEFVMKMKTCFAPLPSISLAILALGGIAHGTHISCPDPTPRLGFRDVVQADSEFAKRYRVSGPESLPQKLPPPSATQITADGAELQDGTMAAGGTLLHSGSGKFLPSDVGKAAFVRGAGNPQWLNSRIVAYRSPTDVVLADPATQAGQNMLIDYGTDNTPIFNAMTDADDPVDPNYLYTGQTGRVFEVPSGTYLFSGTIYTRGGDVLTAPGGTTNVEFVFFDPDPTHPFLRLGANAVTQQSDGSGLDSAVVGILFRPSEVDNVAVDTMGNAGWDVRNCWFLGGIGIHATGTDGIIEGNTFDSTTAIGIKLTGPGDPKDSTNSVLITTNRFYAQRWAAMYVDGVEDVTIQDNYFDYSHQFSIYSDTLPDRNLTIDSNHFRGVVSDQFTSQYQTHLSFQSPLVESKITNNSFSLARLNDVLINSAGTEGLQLSGNSFECSGGTSVVIQNTGPRTSLTNNTFDSPGNYAGDFYVGLDLENNSCSNPFLFAGLPTNNALRACFLFEPGASGITATDNSTDSDQVAAISLQAGAALDDLTGNTSNWSLGAAYIGPGTGEIASVNETSFNAGGAGTVLTESTNPVTGNAEFSGVLTLGSQGLQASDSQGHLLATDLAGLYLGTITTGTPGTDVSLAAANAVPTHCWYAATSGRPFDPNNPPTYGGLPYVTIQGSTVTLSSYVPAGSKFDLFCVYH